MRQQRESRFKSIMLNNSLGNTTSIKNKRNSNKFTNYIHYKRKILCGT